MRVAHACGIGWDDVGDFSSLADLLPAESNQPRILGDGSLGKPAFSDRLVKILMSDMSQSLLNKPPVVSSCLALADWSRSWVLMTA